MEVPISISSEHLAESKVRKVLLLCNLAMRLVGVVPEGLLLMQSEDIPISLSSRLRRFSSQMRSLLLRASVMISCIIIRYDIAI